MMKPILSVLWSMPLCLLLFGSCSTDDTEDLYNSDDNAIYVDAEAEALEFSSDEHFSELKFNSNFWWAMDYQLVVETGDYEQADWFSITPTENFGSRPVMVSLTRNIEKHPRQVVLSFRDKNSTETIKTLTIVQQASDPVIELDRNYQDFSVLGGTIDVRLTTSESWSITAPEWCRISGASEGEKGKQIVVSFDIPRYAGEDRDGEIVFSGVDGDNEAVFIVKQAGTFVSPVPTVVNGAEFTVSWDKPYGAEFFYLNFYAPGGEEPIANLKYSPVPTETQCNVVVENMDWNGYVGPVEVRLETFLAAEMSQESEPSQEFNHNLFDNASGTGDSEDSPCRIANPRHFQNINLSLGKSRFYLQTADIDLSGFRSNSFVPIGTGTASGYSPFAGCYDGGGKLLSNLTYMPDNKQNVTPAGDGCLYTVGVFGYVQGEGARIRNVVLDNIVMSNERFSMALTNAYMASLGLLVGTLDGIGAEIDNCTIRNGKFSVSNKIATTNDNFVFGGMVGRIIGGCTVKNSVVESVVLDQRKGGRIGGVVGWAPKTTGPNDSKIIGRINVGGQMAEPETVNITPISGGIVGVLCSESRIEGCTNYARVKTGMESGGIAGRLENNAVMDKCANYGRVSGICNANKAYIGGLAGNVQRKEGEMTTVRNSFNAGVIDNRCDDKGTNAQYIGGVAGNNQGILQDCYNVGVITVSTKNGAKGANVYVGGLSGLSGNDPKVAVSANVVNCYNAGSIDGLESMKVGIAAGTTNGISKDSSVTFTNVYGDIAFAERLVGDRDSKPEGITALTATQLKSASSYSGWDFSGVWTIQSDSNQGYPSLLGVPAVTK